MYSLCYLLLRCSLYVCAAIVQLYYTYSFYYVVLGVSSDLCAAYLYYFADPTQIMCVIESPTQWLPSTASHHYSLLKNQWWLFRSGCLPSTVNPPAHPCLHQVYLAIRACQACPSKPLLNQHANRCEPFPPF